MRHIYALESFSTRSIDIYRVWVHPEPSKWSLRVTIGARLMHSYTVYLEACEMVLEGLRSVGMSQGDPDILAVRRTM